MTGQTIKKQKLFATGLFFPLSYRNKTK